jgi:hypothetical protein
MLRKFPRQNLRTQNELNPSTIFTFFKQFLDLLSRNEEMSGYELKIK